LGKLSLVANPRGAGLRRALGLVLIGAFCAAAVTFYREGPQLPRSAPAAASGAPTPAGSASPAEIPSPSPSSTASSKPPVVTTSPKELKLPKGPGTTQPGILLMATPMHDGSFDIAEIVSLPTATASLTLAPPQLKLAGDPFVKSKPVASQVQVSAGDQPVVVPGGRVSRRMDIPLVEPVKHIELRYNLRGVTVRSIPSPAGRALAAISPVVAGVPSNLKVAIMVTGSTVLNVACPTLRLRVQTCWTGRPPQVRVKPRLTRDNAVIVIQYDLPRPQ
jgi:hypothetical protein